MAIDNSRSGCSSERAFVFESYGVRVKVVAPDEDLLAEAEQTVRKALVDNLVTIEGLPVKQAFEIRQDPDKTLHLLLNGGEITFDDQRRRFFKFFDSLLRITVAEHASDKVFVHAGVVGWNGKAIVLPADSFGGKTTLVHELVKAGADYFSDEYAVFDDEGLVHPFPRDLSLRYLEGKTVAERDLNVSSIGGTVGPRPIPVGLVVITRYEPDSTWNPVRLSTGQGILEMVPHTIPRLADTARSLKVLNTAVSDAIILKSPRGDATSLALQLLSFFDNNSYLATIT